MKTLNNDASDCMQKIGVNACTDITGFGLLGHLNEMCKGSNLTAKINFKKINFIEGVEKLASNNIVPGGTKNNLKHYESDVFFDNSINQFQKYMLADAQTSGGLLISVKKSKATELLNLLNKSSNFNSTIIGELDFKSNKNIVVVNE